jgi:hypothetical protein
MGAIGGLLWIGDGSPVVSLVDSLNHRLQAGTPGGVRVLGVGSGGVALLNHRLQAVIPPG